MNHRESPWFFNDEWWNHFSNLSISCQHRWNTLHRNLSYEFHEQSYLGVIHSKSDGKLAKDSLASIDRLGFDFLWLSFLSLIWRLLYWTLSYDTFGIHTLMDGMWFYLESSIRQEAWDRHGTPSIGHGCGSKRLWMIEGGSPFGSLWLFLFQNSFYWISCDMSTIS